MSFLIYKTFQRKCALIIWQRHLPYSFFNLNLETTKCTATSFELFQFVVKS